MRTIETDYLIVGAGAMGMAFADTIVNESSARVAIVDRYDKPGGHWTVAYPFVRLHQPSACYGVNSRPLGNDQIEETGWNAGLYELAGLDEIQGYFDAVMSETLLASGRVTFLSGTEYVGEGRCRSLSTGEELQVLARTIVDSTHQGITVPAMRAPEYDVARGATSVAVNDLVSHLGADRFTIVGAGKTGIDACLYLLRHDVDPDRITWIMPRDSWFLDRAMLQPRPLNAEQITEGQYALMTAVAEAESVDDMFQRLEAAGAILRLDSAVTPSMYRCATVTPLELEQLRRISDVVRLGRVESIGTDTIVLEGGSVPTSTSTVHVDCTADGLAKRPGTQVFDGSLITLQPVRACQQVFSAALIAHVELSYATEEEKNALCPPSLNPSLAEDYMVTLLNDTRVELIWAQDEALSYWLAEARLNLFGRMGVAYPEDPDELAAAFEELVQASTMLIEKLEHLIATAPALAAV